MPEPEGVQEVDAAESETAPEATSASPEPEQTTPDTTPEADTTSESETDAAGENKIPYSRFKEVNEKAKRADKLEKRLQELESKKTPTTPEQIQKEKIKQQLDGYLKELGYVSRQELEQQRKQQEADRKLDQQMASLEQKYDGSDGRPKFDRSQVLDYWEKTGRTIGDPEVLYEQMHKNELLDWHIKRASGKSKGIKSESSDGSSKSTGTSDEELMEAVRGGDKSALKTLLKRKI